MIPPGFSEEEHAAFWRGFDLARPPGRQEIDDLARANEVAPPKAGQRCLAISKDRAKAIVAEVEALPDNLSTATWVGFLRGLVAKTSGAPVHVHQGGRA